MMLLIRGVGNGRLRGVFQPGRGVFVITKELKSLHRDFWNIRWVNCLSARSHCTETTGVFACLNLSIIKQEMRCIGGAIDVFRSRKGSKPIHQKSGSNGKWTRKVSIKASSV
jgi:hypothetical protein